MAEAHMGANATPTDEDEALELLERATIIRDRIHKVVTNNFNPSNVPVNPMSQ
jgi:hypothetical protein